MRSAISVRCCVAGVGLKLQPCLLSLSQTSGHTVTLMGSPGMWGSSGVSPFRTENLSLQLMVSERGREQQYG